MGGGEAAVQAVVSQGAVAVAVAGLLVDDFRDGGGHLVGGHLGWMIEVLTGELVAAEDGRDRFGRRDCVVGRNVACGVAPLRGGCYCDQAKNCKPKYSL